jgi:hypothetical protein
MASTAIDETGNRRGGTQDSVTWFLTSICREPLLTASEEIELGNQVQKMMKLLDQEGLTSSEETRALKLGKRSKERIKNRNQVASYKLIHFVQYKKFFSISLINIFNALFFRFIYIYKNVSMFILFYFFQIFK